jgi:hypothetical protein
MPDAPQSGTATLIETNDQRSLNAVWRDNSLWSTAQVVPPSGDDAGEATAHWWEVDTSTPASLSVSQQGNVGGEDIAAGTYTFFPSIAVDGNGNMGIGFAASSAGMYCGAYYTGRLASDSPGTVQSTEVLAAGLDYYVRTFGSGRNRWGDYTGISVDPSDDETFWVFNEYALTRGTVIDSEDGRWGTRFGAFEICVNDPARKIGPPLTYHLTLQAAYTAAGDGDTIQSHDMVFSEDLSINLPKTVTLDEGYNCGYDTVTGQTIINGSLTITDGKLIIG